MSARQVAYSQLVCDAKGCGVVYENIGKPVEHVRELAAKDGWRYQQLVVGRSNWLRRVDICPACPEDAELVPR